MWAVIGFGARSASYLQEGLNDEENRPVDDLIAADRRVVPLRRITQTNFFTIRMGGL
jgi:hypothetical protein